MSSKHHKVKLNPRLKNQEFSQVDSPENIKDCLNCPLPECVNCLAQAKFRKKSLAHAKSNLKRDQKFNKFYTDKYKENKKK